VGIDRTSKFAVAQLVATADRKTAWEFLQHMLEAVPYPVHTVLTDNGIQFGERTRATALLVATQLCLTEAPVIVRGTPGRGATSCSADRGSVALH
jgi:hypothetical protein